MAVRFKPFDPKYLQDPYPTYARLREQAPVQRVRVAPTQVARMLWRFSRMRKAAGEPGLFRTAFEIRRNRSKEPKSSPDLNRLRRSLYAVSTHADVTHVLRHPEIYSSAAMGGQNPGGGSEASPTQGSLIGLDPPEHGEHRAIVNRGFTPRRVADLEPAVRKFADELVSKIEMRESCDLVEEFANPLPVGVIAELLGLDPARRDDFKRWSTALIIGSTQGGGPRFELLREFRAYMTQVVEERRRDPADDLISLLVNAEERESILDAEQVVGFATLLLAAGSETTTNWIGNTLLALRDQPELNAALRADPSRVPEVLEESLRFDSPVQLLMRLVLRDTELHGVPIPEGSMVFVLLGSANRDEAAFQRASEFDVERGAQAHLGFGFGNHFCLGASLARLEARVALETLFERLPDWEISETVVPRHGSFLIRGPATLPMRRVVR
ncbi:MAG: cytochrome P450 [Myxococcota bacterium]|nr:cytochrome P450 [Myxococcota bacterium]